MVHSQFPASFAVDSLGETSGSAELETVDEGVSPRMTKGQQGAQLSREKWRSYPPMMVEVERPYKETASLGDTPILH